MVSNRLCYIAHKLTISIRAPAKHQSTNLQNDKTVDAEHSTIVSTSKRTRRHLKQHIRAHFKSTIVQSDDPSKPHICAYCNLKFSRKSALECHIRIHVGDTWQPPSPNVAAAAADLVSPPLLFSCKNCDRKFSRQRTVEMHFIKCIRLPMAVPKRKATARPNNSAGNRVRLSASAKPAGAHPCPQCAKTFATKQKVFRHMWIHREKAFACEVCGRSFGESHELDAHRLGEHAEVTAFSCRECGKSFASRQGLWEHNRLHSLPAAMQLRCEPCNKTFTSRQGWLIHNRMHSGERPFQCTYCDKSFRDSGTLRKHQRIHTGERPHKCPLCGKGFNQKIVLREHIRWVHAANKCEYAEPAPYVCALCASVNDDREELCTHILKHSDQIVAYNKENAKLPANHRWTIKDGGSGGEEADRAELPPLVSGAKCDRKVVQRNRIILKRYNALCTQKQGVGGATTNGRPKVEKSRTAGKHKCNVCALAFKSRQLLCKHYEIHV